MRCNLAILLFLLLASQASTAEECSDAQRAEAQLPKFFGSTLHATSCPASDNDGTIVMTVSLHGLKTTVETRCESNAYVLKLDTTISFDAGSTPGIGVSTGRGRDGTGMHYWKVTPTDSVIDIGEAPELVQDKFIPNTYSTLITGSGRYQSMRYFYEIRNNHLVATRLVGFYQKNRHTYGADFAKISPSGGIILLRQKTLSEEKASLCQIGRAVCCNAVML
ncbi:hypothetical protein [Paraburkholderia dilworthii]|uniref:hypothetical protein n=1 Tax=Paraburkholderia dilworthii TaxID=948106 RepID=UPI0012691EE5|nr:hypothetical protein [Paraburkholderia dilworthii]